MKKLISRLLLISATGLMPVLAQPENPGTPMPPPEGGPGSPGGGFVPGGPGGPGGPPPEEVQNAIQAVRNAQATLNIDTNAPATIAANTNLVITPAANIKPLVTYSNTFVPPSAPLGNGSAGLMLNFNNVPLDMVLNYLSDAAGFVIVLDTRVNGNISVISSHPMTRDEAVDLLNEELNKNGYAAIRSGRTLTIMDKNDAKTRNIPVRSGYNPEEVPNNDEIVTQIIPIRFVEARQLVSDLSSFVSPQATVVANEAGNAVVITDTQSNIRHLMEIIRGIDDSAEAETEIRVFRLKYASPVDVATELGTVFPNGNNSSGSGSTQSPISFRGGGGFFGRMFGGGGGFGGAAPGGSTSNDRIKKATAVTAVADSRIQAVIVTAPKDLMDQIASMMNELDVPSERDQHTYVFHMNNADPYEAASVLQNMFQSSGTSRGSGSGSSSQSALQLREQNSATTTSSSSTTGTSSGGFSGGGGGRGGNLP